MELKNSEEEEQRLSWWKEKLRDLPPSLNLPYDRPRVQSIRYQSAWEGVILSKELLEKLQTLAGQEDVSLRTVLLAGCKTLLMRYTGQTDIAIAVANSALPEMEKAIDPFAHTVILRSQLSGELTFKQLLPELNALSREASQQAVPFKKLEQVICPEGDVMVDALYQMALVFQSIPFDKSEQASQATCDSQRRSAGIPKCDMTLLLKEANGEVAACLEYNADLFDPLTIKRFLRHYRMLLQAIAKDPNQAISSIVFLTGNEWRQIEDWNSTKADYPQDECIHELFETQVKKTPDAIAVVYEDEALSYRELNKKSNQLANCLIAQSIGPDVKVGLCVERSLDMIIGILGILKAGGAYVPIDPDYPQQRIEYLFSDSGIHLLLTQEGLLDSVPNKQEVTYICLDRDWSQIAEHSFINPNIPLTPANLAYVIYTSGSTGKPKGVMCIHAGLVNRIDWMQLSYPLSAQDRVLQKTPYSFDVSVWEFLWPLITGAQLNIAQPGGHKDPFYLAEQIETQAITTLHFVPSMLEAFIKAEPANDFQSLKRVICSGEALSVSLQNKFFSFFDQTELHNLYGPTEASIDVSFWQCHAEPDSYNVPIGWPIANTQLFILDNHFHPVPIGVAGELYIGGVGLARGYLDNPCLTAEHFLPNPFSSQPGERLYKTGDLACYRDDGNIDYLGRLDHQVKIRGFRIELDEIKASLFEHPAVQDAVVLAPEDEAGDKHLVGYLVAKQGYVPADTEADKLKTEAVDQWRDLYDNTYTAVTENNDPFSNFVSWNSSYTGEPILEKDMREWADTTVDRILALKPQHVLEIGCGTGLLLGRLVSHCKSYVGTDFSSPVITQLESALPQLGEDAEKVRLLVGPADDLSELSGQVFDTIIINSVAQYFPDIHYLAEVLTAAQKLLTPEGKIFVGDVRHLALLEAFHASVQLHHIKDDTFTIFKFRELVQHHVANDKELVIAPAFFQAFKAQSSGISHVQVLPKLGDYRNELSKYRYDVVLDTAKDLPLVNEVNLVPWEAEKHSLDQIQALLTETQPGMVTFGAIANARVHIDAEASRLSTTDSAQIKTVADLKAEIDPEINPGLNPNDLQQIAVAAGYNAEFSWAGEAPAGAFDVIFSKRHDDQPMQPGVFPIQDRAFATAPLQSFANNPRLQDLRSLLLPTLREYLLDKLPDYMVPSFFVILDKFPLTANGKADLKALPALDASWLQSHEYVAPRTEVEQILESIWAGVLNLPEEKIGIENNFFELGGHSLSATQVVTHVREAFDIEIQISDLFSVNTIEALAGVVNEKTGDRRLAESLMNTSALPDNSDQEVIRI